MSFYCLADGFANGCKCVITTLTTSIERNNISVMQHCNFYSHFLPFHAMFAEHKEDIANTKMHTWQRVDCAYVITVRLLFLLTILVMERTIRFERTILISTVIVVTRVKTPTQQKAICRMWHIHSKCHQQHHNALTCQQTIISTTAIMAVSIALIQKSIKTSTHNKWIK